MNNYPPGVTGMDPHFNPPICPECGYDVNESDDKCDECGHELPQPDPDAAYDAYDDAKQEGGA